MKLRSCPHEVEVKALSVNIPGGGGMPSAPTGQVQNPFNAFNITSLLGFGGGVFLGLCEGEWRRDDDKQREREHRLHQLPPRLGEAV